MTYWFLALPSLLFALLTKYAKKHGALWLSLACLSAALLLLRGFWEQADLTDLCVPLLLPLCACLLPGGDRT